MNKWYIHMIGYCTAGVIYSQDYFRIQKKAGSQTICVVWAQLCVLY